MKKLGRAEKGKNRKKIIELDVNHRKCTCKNDTSLLDVIDFFPTFLIFSGFMYI